MVVVLMRGIVKRCELPSDELLVEADLVTTCTLSAIELSVIVLLFGLLQAENGLVMERSW